MRGTEREPPLGYLSRAARFADRIHPSPRSLAVARPSLPRSSSAASSLYRLHRRATLIPLSIAGARRAYIPRRSGRPRAHCDDQEGLVTSVLVCPPFLNPRATSRRVLSTFFFYFVLSVYYSLSLSLYLLFSLCSLSGSRSLVLSVARSSFSYNSPEGSSPLASRAKHVCIHSGYMRAYM